MEMVLCQERIDHKRMIGAFYQPGGDDSLSAGQNGRYSIQVTACLRGGLYFKDGEDDDEMADSQIMSGSSYNLYHSTGGDIVFPGGRVGFKVSTR